MEGNLVSDSVSVRHVGFTVTRELQYVNMFPDYPCNLISLLHVNTLSISNFQYVVCS